MAIRVETIEEGEPLVVSTAPDGLESEDGEHVFRVRPSAVARQHVRAVPACSRAMVRVQSIRYSDQGGGEPSCLARSQLDWVRPDRHDLGHDGRVLRVNEAPDLVRTAAEVLVVVAHRWSLAP